jgi:hypothetical protein
VGGKVGDEENIACADEVGLKEHFKIWARENVNRPTRIVKEGKERVLVDVFIDCQEDVSKGWSSSLGGHAKHDWDVPRKVVAVGWSALRVGGAGHRGHNREQWLRPWGHHRGALVQRMGRVAVHFEDRKALVVVGRDGAPPHGGGPNDGIEDALDGMRKSADITVRIHFFFFLLQWPTKDGFELRAQCKTTAHCGRGGVELVAGGKERRNNWPLEPNFQAHGRAHDLQVIGKWALSLAS